MKSKHETVRLPEPLAQKLGLLSESTGWSRAEVIREFFTVGLDVVMGVPAEGTRPALLKDRLRDAARWHGNNAAARQLELVPASPESYRKRKPKRKK